MRNIQTVYFLTIRMNTSSSRRTKHAFHPQRLPYHKKEHSQTTIDLYLKPIAKVAPGQSDIRNYFAPVAKTKSSPNSELTVSSSLIKTQATTQPSPNGNGATKRQSPGFSPIARVPVETTGSIPEMPARPANSAAPFTPQNHRHANSAVLPNVNPFFANGDDFPHPVSPMAHRVTDVSGRHSLIPKPLNIRMLPVSPAAEPMSEFSPSETTTPSPSSVDTASSLDEEKAWKAPSFRRTYLGVHDTGRRTGESPGSSPLVALRDRSRGTSGGSRRVERPAALRAKTAPQMEGRGYASNDHSVIYFLPKISPTEESEVEDVDYDVEGRGARRGRFEERVRGREDGRRGGRFEKVGEGQMERREDAVGQKDMGVSPGMENRIPRWKFPGDFC